MSARTEVEQIVAKSKVWAILSAESDRLVIFKWEYEDNVQYRCEVCIIFDKVGRVMTWSQWQNRRVQMDEKVGRSDRLMNYLAWP